MVEAVVEELSVKKALFASLDEICKPGVVLATTTSSLPVIECAMATQRPADVVGLHFFNPAQVMQLVEVVSTIRTSAATLATAPRGRRQARQDRGRLRRPGRIHRQRAALPVPQRRGQDAGGQLRHRRRHRHAMKLGCGYPMGPFELLDVVGLDVSLAIQRELYLELREPGFSPRRCWSTWSPPATWAARPAEASATTPTPILTPPHPTPPHPTPPHPHPHPHPTPTPPPPPPHPHPHPHPTPTPPPPHPTPPHPHPHPHPTPHPTPTPRADDLARVYPTTRAKRA